MTDKHSNVQTHVIVIIDTKGRAWVLGTPTQRGFTKAGAEKVKAEVDARVPKGWRVAIEHIVPISDLFAF